jgi:hypothetical protein
MKKMGSFLVITMIAAICSGCGTYNVPFNSGHSYTAAHNTKNFSATTKGPISVKWIPPSFLEHIDVQDAPGVIGGGSQTRIPTGAGLASRILVILDNSIGVIDSSNKILTIEIIKAKTEFEYTAGFFSNTPVIDLGRCELEAEFTIGDKRWDDKFSSESNAPTFGDTSQTAVLEKVWDDIAIQVVQSVLQHL